MEIWENVVMTNFQNLDAWKAAVDLVKKVYMSTSGFPSEEKFGIVSQIRKAAVSVTCNIAEGMGRQSGRDMMRFLFISRGSLYEVQALIILSNELNITEVTNREAIIQDSYRCIQILNGLIKYYQKTGE